MNDAHTSSTAQTNTNTRDRYVSIDIADNAYCLPASVTVELMRMPASGIKRLPRSPEWVAGMLNHRGMVVPVVDMRIVLGCTSYTSEIDELATMLGAREQDHVGWLEELRRCVVESRPFTKPIDPHQCTFGQWFDAAIGSQSTIDRITRGDLGLIATLREFDVPHKRIHAIAEHTIRLATGGRSDEAIAIIDNAWEHELSSMKRLFARFLEQFTAQRHPMLVVIETDTGRTALLIDSVREVVELGLADIDPIPTGVRSHELVRGISHRNRATPVIVFDEHALRTLGFEIDHEESVAA